MSDTVVNDSPTSGVSADATGFFLDGEAPRLGAAPTIGAPASERMTTTGPTSPVLLAGVPTLPVVSPVLSSPTAPLLPNARLLPNATEPLASHSDDSAAEPEHPMAHLMPAKSRPTEAGRRAAEIRAAQKAKSKKVKVGMIAGMMVFTAVVGPPLGKWLVNAINEAGDTTTVVETTK